VSDTDQRATAAVEEALASIPPAERDRSRWLVENLIENGISAGEVAAAYREGRLGLLAVEQWIGEEGGQRLDEIAAAHGLDPDTLARTRRALGLPVERNEPVYGEALAALARRLNAYLEAGFSLDDLLVFNRVGGRGIAAIVATATDLLLERLREHEDDPARRGLLAAQIILGLLPSLEQGIAHLFREHVRQMVRTEAAEQLLGGQSERAQPVGIAFVDLVGFTRAGQAVSAQELSAVAEGLEATASELSGSEVTVVKVIGDEVMLCARDPAELVRVVLDLVAIGADEESDLPPMRAGAALGEVVRRGGDYFGHVVNVASRLTEVAEPHTLLGEQRLYESTDAAVTWKADGSRELRGVERPVEVHVAVSSDRDASRARPEAARQVRPR
jgi:adenylate cyclase